MNTMKKFALYYLRFFARLAIHLGKPSHIVGITGSHGKSSTRNSLHAALSRIFVTKTVFEGNSETGIPLGLLGISPKNYSFFDWVRLFILCPFRIGHLIGIELVIIEMGIDDPYEPKNMEYLLTIVEPDICIFLNVHPVHTQQFEKKLSNKTYDEKNYTSRVLAEIAREKAKLITKNSRCHTAIYNADNEFVVAEIEKYKHISASNISYFAFGKDIKNTIAVQKTTQTLSGTTMSFMYNAPAGDIRRSISLTLKGHILPRAYEEVFAATLLTTCYLGLSADKAVSNIENYFTLPAGRGTILEGLKKSLIVDSSYNASKASTEAYIELMYSLKNIYHRPFVFVFGDMNELGLETKAAHEYIAHKALKYADIVFCTGSLTRQFVMPFFSNAGIKTMWYENAQKLGQGLKHELPENALVLVKGSQNGVYLEEAVKAILANKSDEEKLCRQSQYWNDKKSFFFRHG